MKQSNIATKSKTKLNRAAPPINTNNLSTSTLKNVKLTIFIDILAMVCVTCSLNYGAQGEVEDNHAQLTYLTS